MSGYLENGDFVVIGILVQVEVPLELGYGQLVDLLVALVAYHLVEPSATHHDLQENRLGECWANDWC